LNDAVLDVEVLEPRYDEVRPRLTHVRALGLFGTALAILTTFAALGFTLLMVFGTTLSSALIVWVLWPKVFAPEFTQWVFGATYAPFWKLFLLFLASGAVLKLLRSLIKR
jgi:hypothetical protein